MKLSVTAIKNAKAKAKDWKLYDEDGLFVLVTKSGGKHFKLRYRFNEKEGRLALGKFPDVSLAQAREKRDEARSLIASGIHPGQQRKAEKAAGDEASKNTFEAIAREWFELQCPGWAKSHSDKIIQRLERDIFPPIGQRPITEITAPELLEIIRRIEERATDTAGRALNNCGQVFRYAIQTGRASTDPTRDLRGALKRAKKEHFAGITEPKELAPVLRMLDGYEGSPVVAAALKLMPLLFVRPGELRTALWADIDLDTAEWRYTVTKTETEHIVPLATQAVEILRDLQPTTRHSKYVFAGARSAERPMCDNAVLAAMRRMEIPKDVTTGHGFRATARTILDEVLSFSPDIIEHQLAHAVRGPLGRAYNRTKFLPERKEMMQRWADYLDGLKVGGNVIPIGRRSA